MKYLSTVLITGLISGLLLISMAIAEEGEKPRCDECGMFFENSATRLTASLLDGEDTVNAKFESLGCLHNFVHANHPEAELTKLSILDYGAYSSGEVEYLDGFKAYYLFDTERLKGSMAPFIAAFASKKAAESAQEALGGDLVDFAGMRELMAELMEDAAGNCGNCGECNDCMHRGHGGHGDKQGCGCGCGGH